MKTLILAGEGAIQQVRAAYAQAMAHVGFQCLVWHPNSGKPIFDVFAEFEPEIVMCGSWEISRALYKNLVRRPHIKVILWGGNWGSFDKEIDTKTDPVLMISDEEKQLLPGLIESNNIKHVFTYYHQRWADITHDKWSNIGLTPVGVPLAADLVTLGISDPNDALVCDASFVGGYWPYKAININKFVLPLCHPSKKLNLKIFGYGNWPVAQFLGMLDSRFIPALFASSTVNLNVFEPLAQKYGFDVNERCYKVIACGGFCVSEYCDSAVKDIFTDDEIIFVRTPQQMEEYVKHCCVHPEDRLPYIKRGIHTAKTKHNYFIRLQTIFDKIGISNNLTNNLAKIIEELKQ